MKSIVFALLTLLAFEVSKAQNLLGFGAGFDWIESFEADPMYANKDLNLSFSHTEKVFQVEARQGFRYMENYETMRYNSYLLVGFTTPKEKFFVVDFLVGGAFSFANQKNQGDSFTRYKNQFCPTLKSSFDFRINESKGLYLGVDWLISSYYYEGSDHLGRPMKSGDLTGSVLLSFKYAVR